MDHIEGLLVTIGEQMAALKMTQAELQQVQAERDQLLKQVEDLKAQLDKDGTEQPKEYIGLAPEAAEPKA